MLLNPPDAIITKAYAPILAVGANRRYPDRVDRLVLPSLISIHPDCTFPSILQPPRDFHSAWCNFATSIFFRKFARCFADFSVLISDAFNIKIHPHRCTGNIDSFFEKTEFPTLRHPTSM